MKACVGGSSWPGGITMPTPSVHATCTMTSIAKMNRTSDTVQRPYISQAGGLAHW